MAEVSAAAAAEPEAVGWVGVKAAGARAVEAREAADWAEVEREAQG